MGARGKGAHTPKQPNAGGRPRNTIAREAHEALAEPGMRAIKTLDELQLSPKERKAKGLPPLEPEDRTRLLAAKAVLDAWLRPAEEKADPKDNTYKIKWQDTDYRVPAG